MIKFINNNKTKPYLKFQDLYKKALSANQNSIEAIAISSYDSNKKEVDSRFVNLKIVDNEKFIFFSNYCSPKSVQFNSFNQTSVDGLNLISLVVVFFFLTFDDEVFFFFVNINLP